MFRVGDFVFDPNRAELAKGNEIVKIEPQLNILLKLFVENAGELVAKDTIVQTLWSERVITDDAFRAVIKKLRKCLQDSARDPRYIRTLPLKGYILIANVKRMDETEVYNEPGFAAKAAWWVVASSFLLFVFSVLLYWLISSPASTALTALTDMDGSEVSPSYNARLNQLVFSHRANKDDYLQLYAKALNSGNVTRLTFDQANYANGQLAADGNKIAFTRSTPEQNNTYIAGFSAQHGLSNITALPDDVAGRRYFQAWSSDSSGLYLSDLKQPGQPQGIWYYHLASHKLTSVTSSSGLGSGDYFARESNDGRFLAILRNIGANDNELLIQHIQSGELVHVYKLPRLYQHLVWDKADNIVMLSSFYTEFAQYDLTERKFKVLPLGIKNTNSIFYSCGERCFFARQHNGNYLELVKQPNPFAAQPSMLRRSWHQDYLQFSDAEDFPVAGQQSGNIYFINKSDKESQIAVVQNNTMKVLKRFPVNSEFSALQVNQSETYLAGLINGRLFLLALKDEQFQFITTELEKVVSMQWVPTGQHLHYARIEHSKPVLYRYEIQSDTKIRDESNLIARYPLDGNQTLIIDSNFKIWRYATGHEPTLLCQLPDVSPNRWKVNGNWVYYTGHEENLAYLYRTNLITATTEKQLIAKNRYRLNFDLSADGATMLAVRSVLAQSDLVRVEY